MPWLIRTTAVLAAVSVLATLWFISAFVAQGGLAQWLRSGALGAMTIVGWVITLVVGPVATVQLWRFRASGRRAGIVLFGFGLVYYVVGLTALRAPGAPIAQIVVAAITFAAPLLLLLSRRAAQFFSEPSVD